MHRLLRGYYQPTQEEFDELWEKYIFAFDTNILLNVYRYGCSQATTTKFT
jgi:hypothetical protein